jgi:hypothetical protein
MRSNLSSYHAVSIEFVNIKAKKNIPDGFIYDKTSDTAIFGHVLTRIRYDTYRDGKLLTSVTAYRFFRTYDSFEIMATKIKTDELFYFIGAELDPFNDEYIDEKQLLATEWCKDRTFVFANIPHYEEPLM